LLPQLLLSILVSLIVVQMAVFATTIYLHRSATHRGLILHPRIALLFRAVLWLTTGIVTREWVAVHRKHHAHTDEDGDPHSPWLEGFWPVQLGNVFFYIRAARRKEIVDKYASDIKPDAWDRWLFDHGAAGLLVGTVILCLTLGLGWGLLAAALHAFLYVGVLSPSVNGLCHYVGYKNYENTATNIRIVALLTGGEGLHNNHHGRPRRPKFSERRGEFDPAWPVISLLTRLGLARAASGALP
jgi:stearoyl-CoA desaturase (delta-9 desaturase)